MAAEVMTAPEGRIIHKTYAVLSGSAIPQRVYVTQYDESLPVIACTLYKDGQLYTIPDGASVRMRMNKNGLPVYHEAMGIDDARHVVYLEITAQMTVLYGEFAMVIEVETSDGKTAGTSYLRLIVRQNPVQNPELDNIPDYTANSNRLTAEGVKRLQDESSTQQKAIEDKGKNTLESIPADYSTLSGKVDKNTSGISELKEDLANKNFAELHDISFEENMIDLSCIIEGFINENGDYQYEAQWQFINKFVPVKPNTKYYRLVNSVYEQIVLYDNNKNFISTLSLFADNGTGKDGYFETPENCYFIKFQATKSGCDYNTQVYSQIRPTKYVESNTTAKITIPYNVYSENVKESETSDVVCWGDSLTEGANGATPYTTKLAELLGSNYTVINRGKGGDTAEGIACRQGGLPIYLQPCSLSNTAHEAVNVVFKNIIDESVKPMFDSAYNGQRANINGKSYYISLRGENRQPVLCAYTDGEGQTIDRPYYLHFGEYDTLKNKTMVIWSGSNNAPNEETVENVIQKIRAMIGYNGNNNYIVIGLTSLTAMPDVLKCNRKMALAFGIHFLDISNYLRNYALDDLGISETSQDVIDKNNGDIPSSLRTDPVHLTSGANEVVANQIYKKGKELGYW